MPRLKLDFSCASNYWRPDAAANKLGDGPQLHWLGFIFQEVVVYKNPHAIDDAISKAPINAFSTPFGTGTDLTHHAVFAIACRTN